MKRLTICGVVCALALVPAPSRAQTPIQEVRDVASDVVVEVENLAGSIRVSCWAQNQVEITGTLGRGTEELEVEGDARRLHIEVELPRRAHGVDGSDLELRVPVGASLEVESVSADISVLNCQGKLELESVSGRVEVSGTPARLDATSVSGDVAVAVAPSGAQLESVSGDVVVERASGELEASSVSGAVRIEGGHLHSAELATTSGPIFCAAGFEGHGTLDMESTSGAITLVVAADVAAEFELSTFSGTIRNQIGPEPERTSRFTPGSELLFTAGSGGPRVSVETFSGAIELKTR